MPGHPELSLAELLYESFRAQRPNAHDWAPWEILSEHERQPFYRQADWLTERDLKAPSVLRQVQSDLEQLRALLNTPEIDDFDKAVPLEAAHQVQRWGTEHDGRKEPEDWFWLIGYLAGKALHAWRTGDIEKAKHHCISAAAALRNWHAHVRSGGSKMRPGMPNVDEVPTYPSGPYESRR